MSDMRFFGSYATFKAKTKNSGAELTGANHIVGSEYTVEFLVEEGKTVAWAKNRFGKLIGFFDDQVTYRLDVMRGRGWSIYALLSEVGFTQPPGKNDSSYYWGEVALFACPGRYNEETRTFMAKVGEKLAEGIRPDIDLTSSSIDTMLEKHGDWLPDKKTPKRPKEKGVVVLKSTETLSEKAIEKGRAGNIGCYVVSYAFIAAVVIVIILVVKTLLGW